MCLGGAAVNLSVPLTKSPLCHTMEREPPKEEISMAENESTPEYDCRDYFKEAVCIDAMRIYDSCSDKDCLEDIRVLFPAAGAPPEDRKSVV